MLYPGPNCLAALATAGRPPEVGGGLYIYIYIYIYIYTHIYIHM